MNAVSYNIYMEKDSVGYRLDGVNTNVRIYGFFAVTESVLTFKSDSETGTSPVFYPVPAAAELIECFDEISGEKTNPEELSAGFYKSQLASDGDRYKVRIKYIELIDWRGGNCKYFFSALAKKNIVFEADDKNFTFVLEIYKAPELDDILSFTHGHDVDVQDDKIVMTMTEGSSIYKKALNVRMETKLKSANFAFKEKTDKGYAVFCGYQKIINAFDRMPDNILFKFDVKGESEKYESFQEGLLYGIFLVNENSDFQVFADIQGEKNQFPELSELHSFKKDRGAIVSLIPLVKRAEEESELAKDPEFFRETTSEFFITEINRAIALEGFDNIDFQSILEMGSGDDLKDILEEEAKKGKTVKELVIILAYILAFKRHGIEFSQFTKKVIHTAYKELKVDMSYTKELSMKIVYII